MQERLFVTGIGTGVGKSIVSAILVEALGAEYWKPLQCGDLERSDTALIKILVRNPAARFHPEQFRLQLPLSPHAAAESEGLRISVKDFKVPQHKAPLIIEGAGGVMVPMNGHELMLDLITHCQAEVVLVSQIYLGSINHTLLTYEALKARKISVRGIVFNGPKTESTTSLICGYTGLDCLLHLDHHSNFGRTQVKEYAEELRVKLEMAA